MLLISLKVCYGTFVNPIIMLIKENQEMLPSLDNFISYGSDIIQQRADYKMMILDIYQTAIKSDQLGEIDRVNACKLIESLLLNLRGHVDDVSTLWIIN